MKRYPQKIIDYAIDNKISLEEAAQFLHAHEEEREIEAQEDNLSPEEEDSWAKYQQIQKDLQQLYKEQEMLEALKKHTDDEITREEMDWVEQQLLEIDEQIKAGLL